MIILLIFLRDKGVFLRPLSSDMLYIWPHHKSSLRFNAFLRLSIFLPICS